jgi:uroporphyrinogen decarboxylase
MRGRAVEISMNNREWVLGILDRRVTAPVPFNFGFSPMPRAALEKHYHTDNVEQALNMPIRMNGCASIKPLYAAPAKFGDTAADEFGVVWSTSDIDRGSPIRPCLKEADLASFRWPDSAAAYRFEHLAEWTAAQRENFSVLWVGDLWERATFMRGMEDILLDVALDKPFVQRLLRGIADHIMRTMRILFDRFQFDAIALSDDYGAQRSMIMSPADWRLLIKPLLAEIYALAHAHGRKTFHHSCGHIRPIIGELIDIGLDILHPIQPEAMDILELKREFGRDIAFCGGVRTQDLLPCGTPEQIRQEVRRLKSEMGAGGGYILEPGITLQADVPLENMIALIEEAR